MKQVLCINAAGKGGQDEIRVRRLSSRLNADVTIVNVDKGVSRQSSTRSLWSIIRSKRWDLIYQENTGIAAGLPLILAGLARRQRFIISSGDPVSGYFRVTKGPIPGAGMHLYEMLLYRTCTGFIGWTPYLTGRAIAMGARRGVTIEGAVDMNEFIPYPETDRIAAKRRFGLDPSHLVCGVVGSLNWNPRHRYCYGLELVETLKRLKRQDVSILIVGDGSGKSMLERLAPGELKSRVVFTGRLPQDQVVCAMNAMDIGFITQTLDDLGNYRLTTKLPEYLACGLPVAMSPVPGFYDYAAPAGWPLPPLHPTHPIFHDRCAAWIEALDKETVADKALKAREVANTHFDYEHIQAKFSEFIYDLLD